MNYKKIEEDSYNLFLLKTNKFKTIFFKFVFWEPIKKEEITIRNLLVDNLTFSTSNHPSKKEMSIYKQDLYGVDLMGYNKRIGNYIYTEIYMSILNPKYTDETMLNKSFYFLRDVILNPNVNDGNFDKEIFQLIKNNTRDEIIRFQENPNIVALNRLNEEVDNIKPFSYRLEGDISLLEKITSDDLYNYYKNFLKNNNVDVFVIGDIDCDEMQSLIRKEFVFEKRKKIEEPINIVYENNKRAFNEVIDKTSFNQSKLAIACNLNKLTMMEKKYPLVLYNIIIGNSPESKFFKNIREKKSYAYSISSSFRRYDDLLYITAGISYKNYEFVKNAIFEEMSSMKLGNFTDEDLLNAKKLYISVLKDTEEYASSITDYICSLEYLESDSINTQIELINKVSMDDIVDVANRIDIDTIYLLKEND